jgi:hypothetical protein
VVWGGKAVDGFSAKLEADIRAESTSMHVGIEWDLHQHGIAVNELRNFVLVVYQHTASASGEGDDSFLGEESETSYDSSSSFSSVNEDATVSFHPSPEHLQVLPLRSMHSNPMLVEMTVQERQMADSEYLEQTYGAMSEYAEPVQREKAMLKQQKDMLEQKKQALEIQNAELKQRMKVLQKARDQEYMEKMVRVQVQVVLA